MYYGGSETHVLTNCLAAKFAEHSIYSLVPNPGDDNDFSVFFLEHNIPIYYNDFDLIRKDFDIVHFYSGFQYDIIKNGIDKYKPAVWTMTFNTSAYKTKCPVLCTSFQTLLNQLPENESYLYRCAVDIENFNPKYKTVHDGINLIRICSTGKSELLLDQVVADLLNVYSDVNYYVIQDTSGVVHDRIHYLGRQKDIKPYLFNADLFVYAPKQPSACTCDICIIEPMACGIPVVATKDWQVTEQISHGDTGIFVEHEYESMKRGIEYFLRNRDQLSIFGINARRRAEELFDINKRMTLLKYLYEKEIEKSK